MKLKCFMLFPGLLVVFPDTNSKELPPLDHLGQHAKNVALLSWPVGSHLLLLGGHLLLGGGSPVRQLLGLGLVPAVVALVAGAVLFARGGRGVAPRRRRRRGRVRYDPDDEAAFDTSLQFSSHDSPFRSLETPTLPAPKCTKMHKMLCKT